MIFILVVNDTALVFDLPSIQILRDLGIVGVLTGTLPRAPQQNVFLGLPLRLSVYETCWLVSNKCAILVDGEKYNGELSLTASHNRSCRLPLDGVPHYAVTLDVYKAPGVKAASENNGAADGKDGHEDKDVLKDTKDDLEEDGISEKLGGLSLEVGPVTADDSDSNLITGGDSTDQKLEKLLDPNATVTLDEFLSGQTLPPDFFEKFAAFAYLRTRGYFMMPGLRFGGTFVAYPGDPLQFHSHLIVKVLGDDKKFNLIELVTSGRLATAVKKAWVVMGRDKRQSLAEVIESLKPTLPDPDRISPAPMRAYSIEWAGFG